MIDVLHVIGTGQPGGGTTVVLTLCKGLIRLGLKVGVAAPRGSYILEQAEHLGATPVPLEFASRLESFKSSRMLHRAAMRLEPRIVHAHGARAGFPVCLARLDTPTVYTVHGFHYKNKKNPVRLAARLVERYCISSSSHTIFVSQSDFELAQKDKLIQKASAASVVYNPTILPEGITFSEPEFDLIFAGRLHEQKNPLILPEIVEELKSIKIKMLIVGGGDLEIQLRDKIRKMKLESYIVFAGEQSHLSTLDYIARSSMLILTSRWEGLPVVAVEAMLIGVPVLASNIAGNREVISDSHNGFLVSPDNPSEYARRFMEIRRDPDLLKSVTQIAQEQARTLFSFERQVCRHVEIYDRLAGGSLGGEKTT